MHLLVSGADDTVSPGPPLEGVGNLLTVARVTQGGGTGEVHLERPGQGNVAG